MESSAEERVMPVNLFRIFEGKDAIINECEGILASIVRLIFAILYRPIDLGSCTFGDRYEQQSWFGSPASGKYFAKD